jgi:alkylation response protein AidB-like acyl-CoA dehydrogenase
MHEARLFQMYIPKALDGLETDPITSMIVIEEIARADAAAAWNLMLGATYGLWAAFLTVGRSGLILTPLCQDQVAT